MYCACVTVLRALGWFPYIGAQFSCREARWGVMRSVLYIDIDGFAAPASRETEWGFRRLISCVSPLMLR